jgi:hypothetical protein
LAIPLLAALSLVAVAWFFQQGYVLYYGDAQAHLNIARRIVDSRNPGYFQIGTVWLPLPHLLMLPFVRNESWWRNGLAGAIPSSICFVIAGTFFFAAARRVFGNRAAAVTGLCVFALNPNLLYLQSSPMTEPLFFAGLAALLYFTVRFRETQSAGSVLGAALAVLVATLTRYEGWFLIPFVSAFFLLAAKRKRLFFALLFGAVASLGPLYWLAHNWWFYGDFLEFYRGPYSAKAIYQRALDGGMAPYPGDHEWRKAWSYFRTAVQLCAGWPLVLLGIAGALVAVRKRALRWPLFLLGLPPLFYLCSIHSGGTPIFVPHLWPNTYYNTRYGLSALAALAFAAGALVFVVPPRFRPVAALAVIGMALSPWIRSPLPEAWICWKESQVNSEARRAWTKEAAGFLRHRYRPGSGIFMSFGDLTGILQEAGIPLRETLYDGNVPHWDAAVARPDLFLREEWAVAISGDRVSDTLVKAGRTGPHYECLKTIALKGAPVIQIYRRAGQHNILSHDLLSRDRKGADTRGQ